MYQNIYLAEICKSDIKKLSDLFERNYDFLRPYAECISQTAKHELLDLSKSYFDCNRVNNQFVFCIYLKEGRRFFNPGKLIGLLLILDFDPKLSEAEIGYLIDEKFSRQGYTSAAVKLAESWLKRKFRVQNVRLEIKPENTPSINFAKKNGYKFFGCCGEYHAYKKKLV